MAWRLAKIYRIRLLIVGLAACSIVGCDAKVSSQTYKLNKDSQNPGVIYGTDYRQELYENVDPVLAHVAQATVALVNVDHLTEISLDRTEIGGQRLNQKHHFCPTERYLDQIIGAVCSGVLVGPDLVVTAGHCIQSQYDCSMTRFIFDYAKQGPFDPGTIVPNSNVYECAEVLHTQTSGPDFAVIRLARAVEGRIPLELRASGEANIRDPLSAVGFPAGIPMKLVHNGFVRSFDPAAGTLNATLDLFNGNSGSPVVNSITGLVEGIVWWGEDDYETVNGCLVSKVCDVDGCIGETISLATEIQPFIYSALHLTR